MLKIIVGAIIGSVAGIPVSYYFQSEYIRAKVSLTQYMEAIFTEWDELAVLDAQAPVIFAVVLGCVAGGIIGALLGRRPAAK